MAILVFDVGGTTTRAALYDPELRALTATARASTPNHLDHPAAPFEVLRTGLLDVMQHLGGEVAEHDRVSHIGIAFAGPVGMGGEVLAAPTVWGSRLARPCRLREDVAQRWPGACVAIMNDVTAAGYRYLRHSEDELCIVTVSSGIGHKVFVSGRPLVGPRATGGELGHLTVDDSADAPACECGGRGHLGAVASGRGVLSRARAEAPQGVHLTSSDLVAAFKRGDRWAREVVQRSAGPLGLALAGVHLGVGIERFVLVGGFALALGEAYRCLVASAAAARCWKGDDALWNSRVELGIPDDFAGLIGAGIAVSVATS